MQRIIIVLTSVILMLCVQSAQTQDANAADGNLQQQLQRLQSAVQQVRQSGPNVNNTPAFMPQQPNQAIQGITPPPAQQAAPQIAMPQEPPQGLQQNPQFQQQGTPPPQIAGQGPVPAQLPDQATEMVQGGGMAVTEDLRDHAFTDTSDNLLPLTPDQIRTLHTLFSRTQRAVAEHPGIPPRPTSTSKIVNLAPGATPPIIRLAAGYVTSLVFLDATGAPWPVAAYDLGDPRSYNIQWDKKGNTMLVQAITEYKTGNLAVLLQGLNTPVMLTLIPGQRAVDYRVDLRIPGLGPNAIPSITSQEILPGASNPLLLDVLNGVPPPCSKALQIVGRDCQVWLLGGKIYLRTRLTVLSPGWISTLSSADGMHAYEMPQTPVILASENGKMVKLTIQGL